MNEQSLQVTPEIDSEIACYRFSGIVDAYSSSILASLSQDPPENSNVILDFSGIHRINSMGLALLLKMLNAWEEKGKRIQVINLNRMAAILFKITGLGRFLDTGETAETSGQSKKTFQTTQPASPPTRDKLQLFAHLQTSQQLNGWFLFNTHLQRQLQRSIQFQSQTLAERNDRLAQPQADLVFAGPFEACRLIANQGFVPLAKPDGETDEVVILTHSEDERPLADITTPKVAVASKNTFTYLLGRFLCDEKGLNSDLFQFHESGNDIKAVQFLIRRRVDCIMMSLKTFEGLSSLSRRQLRVVDQSQTELAAYLFCAAPYLDKALQNKLQSSLTQMGNDEKGRQLLNDLEIRGWVIPERGEVDMLLKVYQTYAH